MRRISVLLFLNLFVFVEPCFTQGFTPESNYIFPQEELTTFRIEMNQNSLDSLLNGDVYFASNHAFNATVQYEASGMNSTLSHVGIRLRGNTSLTAAKKSFKLDFNAFVPGQMLMGIEKLNLNANQNDPSICRAALSWDIIKKMELPASRTSFTKLYINDAYMGVYVATEHLDEEFIKHNYEKDYGNLYKCLWPAPLDFIGEDPNLYKFESNGRRAYDLKTNKLVDDYSDLAHFISVLNNTSNEAFVCEIEQVFNVADYLKILALDVLTGNWDGYAGNKNNYYLYFNPQTQLFDYIPYDLDNTWGIDWLGESWQTEPPYNWASNTNFGEENRPLYDRILAVNEYKNLYTYYINDILNNWFNEEFVMTYISARQSLLTEAISQDDFYPLGFGFSDEDFQTSLFDAWGSHVEYGLIEWVETRSESILNQLNNQMQVLVLHQLSDNAPVLDTLKIHAEVYASNDVQVSALIDPGNGLQSFSMFDDGLHGDGQESDGLWGVEIPILPDWISVEYRVRVSTDNSPRIAPCSPITATVGINPNNILINELMSSNATTVTDEAMEFDDWCELYNAGLNSIELNQFYLTDNLSRPDKFALPEVLVEANERTFYWLDNDPEQGSNHAPFRLSSDGEELALFQKEGHLWHLRDYIAFGPIDQDISFGRVEDGASQWQWFQSPTPNSTNHMVDIKENAYNHFKAWPNPTEQGIIKFNTKYTGSIHNLIGAKVANFNDTDVVDISKEPPGLYTLKTLKGEIIQIIKY